LNHINRLYEMYSCLGFFNYWSILSKEKGSETIDSCLLQNNISSWQESIWFLICIGSHFTTFLIVLFNAEAEGAEFLSFWTCGCEKILEVYIRSWGKNVYFSCKDIFGLLHKNIFSECLMSTSIFLNFLFD